MTNTFIIYKDRGGEKKAPKMYAGRDVGQKVPEGRRSRLSRFFFVVNFAKYKTHSFLV